MIEHDGNTVRISGALTLGTIISLRAAATGFFDAGDVVVDLQAVTEVDSSALSLLLEWRREAQRHNVHVHYRNFPPNLTSLATLYGVNEIVAGN